jgi:hypothetical protein
LLDMPDNRLAAPDPRDGLQLSHETYVMIGETRMVTFPMGAAKIRADAVRTVPGGMRGNSETAG